MDPKYLYRWILSQVAVLLKLRETEELPAEQINVGCGNGRMYSRWKMNFAMLLFYWRQNEVEVEKILALSANSGETVALVGHDRKW